MDERYNNLVYSNPSSYYKIAFSNSNIKNFTTDLLSGTFRIDFFSNVKGNYKLDIDCGLSSWSYDFSMSAGITSSLLHFFFFILAKLTVWKKDIQQWPILPFPLVVIFLIWQLINLMSFILLLVITTPVCSHSCSSFSLINQFIDPILQPVDNANESMSASFYISFGDQQNRINTKLTQEGDTLKVNISSTYAATYQVAIYLLVGPNRRDLFLEDSFTVVPGIILSSMPTKCSCLF